MSGEAGEAGETDDKGGAGSAEIEGGVGGSESGVRAGEGGVGGDGDGQREAMPRGRRQTRSPVRAVRQRRSLTPGAPGAGSAGGDARSTSVSSAAKAAAASIAATAGEIAAATSGEAALMAARRAAERAQRCPVLPLEIVADLSGRGALSGSLAEPRGSPNKATAEKTVEAGGEALGAPVLALDLERGQISGGALPPNLEGAGCSVKITNSAGAPILGHLSVGAAKLSFALYESRERMPSAAEVATPNPKLREALRGLALPMLTVAPSRLAGGAGMHGIPTSGAFVSSPFDGVPTHRLTVFDPAAALAVEAQIDLRGMRVVVRRATAAEVRRAEADAGLREAEAGTDYAFLHGRIVAARARGVEQRRLDAAQAKLKTLQPDAATQEELVAALRWERVTADPENTSGQPVGRAVCEREGCTVGQALPGENLSFVSNAAEIALKGIKTDGVAPDRWLFERIAAAAAAAAKDGGVWRSGGKFILSAITRNQSPVALNRYLNTIGQKACADGIDALVKWTERKYDHHVSAIQINVHIDSSSFHAQHRDIYGLEQRDMAGRDCTCSFQPNIATACLSLGSTRRCLVEAETDEFSELCKCCDDCQGYACSHWMASGGLMYFNDVWNRSHNHGVPKNAGDADADGNGGPRISIALLCAAATPDPLSLSCPLPKNKNIYATLLDKNKTLAV